MAQHHKSIAKRRAAATTSRRLPRLLTILRSFLIDKRVTNDRVAAPVNAALHPPPVTVVDAGAQSGIAGYLTTVQHYEKCKNIFLNK